MVYLGEEIRRDYNYINIIDRLKILIQNYKELIKERGNFVDKTPEEKEKSKAILQVIEDVLTELRKIEGFEEKAEQLRNICEDIINRYNALHERDIESELDEIDEFINSYNLKPHFPFSKYGEHRQPTDEEIQKYIKVDLFKGEEQKNKENRKQQDKIDLSNDIDGLIIKVNHIIDVFYREHISLHELINQEIETTNNLPMPIHKESWIKNIFNRIINKIRALLGNGDNVVADVPYQEVEEKKYETSKSLKIDTNKDVVIIPIKNKKEIDFTRLNNDIGEIINNRSVREQILYGRNDASDDEKPGKIFEGIVDDKSFIIRNCLYNVSDGQINNSSCHICMDNRYFNIHMYGEKIMCYEITSDGKHLSKYFDHEFEWNKRKVETKRIKKNMPQIMQEILANASEKGYDNIPKEVLYAISEVNPIIIGAISKIKNREVKIESRNEGSLYCSIYHSPKIPNKLYLDGTIPNVSEGPIFVRYNLSKPKALRKKLEKHVKLLDDEILYEEEEK